MRNVGANFELILPLKRGVESGHIVGPRIIAAAGGITPTGGHGERQGYRPDILEAVDNAVGVCDGADDCRILLIPGQVNAQRPYFRQKKF